MLRKLVALLVVSSGLVVTAPAWACGGCFTMAPPQPNAPPLVVQDAERILFVRDEANKTSHVWVEVRYTGLAKDFGWVLPLPKVPKVGVGTQLLFDQLDSTMHPRYLGQQTASENCRAASQGCDYAPSVGKLDAALGDSASYGETSGNGGQQPQVTILGQGTTGPYDYTIVKGTDVAVLFDWLNSRGYAMPEKAKPILQSHVAKGDVFVAIKLSNGQGINAIRPITLEMTDAEPCVPLRLTSIAAAEEMSVVVTVAGAGRAVVKNHLDVVPNPMRMTLLLPTSTTGCANGGTAPFYCDLPKNYQQVLAQAIDEVGGHAFVTEASIPVAESTLAPANWPAQLLSWKDATNLWTMGQRLAALNLPINAELADAVALPLGLTSAFPDTSPVQALANLVACTQYWQQAPSNPCTILGPLSSPSQLEAVPADGAAAAKAVQQGILDPLYKVSALLGAAPRLTRLAMRVSPEEMDRDPVFAFNAELPQVPRERIYTLTSVCLDGWDNGPRSTRITWPGLGSWRFEGPNATDPRFLKAPFALSAVLLDETGSPTPIAPSQYELVDTAILGALPGKPSLPKDLVIQPVQAWVGPASDPPVTAMGPWHQPGGGCLAKSGWSNGKLPPNGAVLPLTDAAAGDLDASGGASATPAPNQDDGCSAGRGGSPGSRFALALLAAGALGLLALRRRRGCRTGP